MEEFKENIGDMYYEKAVKLMDEVEERYREEEREKIRDQLGRLRKATTRKEVKQDAAAEKLTNKESSLNVTTSPTNLDDNAVRTRIDAAGNVFKKFNSLLTRQQEVLLTKLIHNDSMCIDNEREADSKLV